MSPNDALDQLVDYCDQVVLTPGADVRMRELLEVVKPGLADQIDAASKEAFHAATLALGARDAGASTLAAVPPWVRRGALRALCEWGMGLARVCQHSPVPTYPAPAYAAAWRPSVVSCLPCSAWLLHTVSKAENETCDGCRRRVPAGIYPAAQILSGLTWMFGVCSDCRWDRKR